VEESKKHLVVHNRCGQGIIIRYSEENSIPVVANKDYLRFIAGINEGPNPPESIAAFRRPELLKELSVLSEGERVPWQLFSLIADLYALSHENCCRRVNLEYGFKYLNIPPVRKKSENVREN